MHSGLDDLVRRGKLYPSVILHGADPASRVRTAIELSRALLCVEGADHQPPCSCRHCRRIAAPSSGAGSKGDEVFHPDVHFLAQDLRTVTSTEATRRLLRAAQMSPFEAGGQVFVVLSAETLSDEAANVLLKILEEPPTSAPRHFFLLCPSADRLLPTLRSRSLSVYLGAVGGPDPEEVSAMATTFEEQVRAFMATGSAAYVLSAAAALLASGKAEPRDSEPWSMAAAAVLVAYRSLPPGSPVGAGLLGLAEDLLQAVDMRTRGIQPPRILEGLVSKALAGGR